MKLGNALNEYKNGMELLEKMEGFFKEEFIEDGDLDIKKKVLSHLKARQESLKYVGGKYLVLPMAGVFLTLLVNMILQYADQLDNVSIISGVIAFIALIFLIFKPIHVHYRTESELLTITIMIETLEQQIKDNE
ncbi:hypothetical protein [Terribacillus saccharophilus]|uniref:hypothetical protein n=1 Tax=Terribacillus saccharophilus TaxID=361277 RepID=UPI002989A7E5|nr:hypothetical protein [Terribacillus saccharophilus]MCM3227531.1 hypothetical protein [Terribacillus saccharophilus]